MNKVVFVTLQNHKLLQNEFYVFKIREYNVLGRVPA